MVLLAFAHNGQGISHFMFLEVRHSAVLSLRNPTTDVSHRSLPKTWSNLASFNFKLDVADS